MFGRFGSRGGGAFVLVAALLIAGCGGTNYTPASPATRDASTQPQTASTKAAEAWEAKLRKEKRLAAADPLTLIGVKDTVDGGPSGVSMPAGNLRGWKQVFADDFPASEDAPLGSFAGCSFDTHVCSSLPSATSAKWFAYPDGTPDTWGEGEYTPSQVATIHGGMLRLHLHTSTATGIHEVAALVPKIPTTTGLEGMRYGAYALRFRAESLPGYESAFQLWPDSHDGLGDGEIGFPAGPLSGHVLAWQHWQNATTESMSYQFPTKTQFGGGWHTAVIEREPGRLRFILDGRVVATATRHLPDTPMYWVLQTEVQQAPNTPSASVSGQVDVAWATAYTWHPTTSAPTPTA